jgi:aryl-alcohol dehydrogenase-like predicted oxidoreductase
MGMNYRNLGRTGMKISEVSLGTWQVGGGWGGSFDDAVADRIINTAIDNGVNFIDTADVYDAGLSEAAVGKVVRSRSEQVFVATKCGRQVSPHVNEGYTPEGMRAFVEASLKNSGLERLDLIQLHCPPTEVFYRPEIFEVFDRLKDEGKIANLGVSVEKVEEARKAIEFDNVRSVQIIFNMFRLRPREHFFQDAVEKGIGIIVRVPLASGLLSGKITRNTTFDPKDHRTFNRDGAAFDKGETFSGVPFDTALDAVDELREVLPSDVPMAQSAIRWILDHPAVSTVIPGASRVEQVLSNIAASDAPPISPEIHDRITGVYDARIRGIVHHLW